MPTCVLVSVAAITVLGIEAEPTLSRGRPWRSLIAGTALIVAGVLPGFLTASLSPRIRLDFPFGDATVGVAVAVFYLVCTLSSTPGGRLVERIGPLPGMRLGAAATVASCLGIALFAGSAPALIVLLVLGGLGNAIGGPAVSGMLRRTVESARHGLAFGAQQSGASLGALLAGLALPAVAIPFDWRWAFVGAAVLALVAVSAAPDAGPPQRAAAEASAPSGAQLRTLRTLAVAAALASAAGVGFVSFLVLYSIHRGLSEQEAGLLLGAVSLAATVSRVGLGMLADRSGRDPLGLTALTLAFSAAGYLALITPRSNSQRRRMW
jgi:MFS family permease